MVALVEAAMEMPVTSEDVLHDDDQLDDIVSDHPNSYWACSL